MEPSREKAPAIEDDDLLYISWYTKGGTWQHRVIEARELRVSGQSLPGVLTESGNLEGLNSVSAARDNLKLGSAATHPASDFADANHNHDGQYLSQSEGDSRYLSQSEGDGRYLGQNAKAADSDKLDGHDSSYFAQTSQLFSGQYSDLSGTPNLAPVATSGKYSDLTGTPDHSQYITSESDPTVPGYLKSSSQGAAVADATGSGDVVQQLNALITSLENANLIAK